MKFPMILLLLPVLWLGTGAKTILLKHDDGKQDAKPFYAYEQYDLNDLRDALIALENDAAEVNRIFGP